MAENFDIAKFLKENSLGSYGILGKYVDLQPLKEVDGDYDMADIKKFRANQLAMKNKDWNSGESFGNTDAAFKINLDGPVTDDMKQYAELNGIEYKDVSTDFQSMFDFYADDEETLKKFIDEFYSDGADEDDLEAMYDGIKGSMSETEDLSGQAAQEYDSEETGFSGKIQLSYYDHPSISTSFGKRAVKVFQKWIASKFKGTATVLEDESPWLDEITFKLSGLQGVSSIEDVISAYHEMRDAQMDKVRSTGGPFSILASWMVFKPEESEIKEDEEDLGGWDGDRKNVQYDGQYDDKSGPAIANENKEQEGFDRMMGLIDQSLVSKLPLLKKAVDLARTKGLSDSAIFNMLSSNSLVSKSVNDLVDDGFDSQDIVDFFGTDFSEDDPQFEDDMSKMINRIVRGYGYIDPEYVEQTWEMASDIPFEEVQDKVFAELVRVGLTNYDDIDEVEEMKEGDYEYTSAEDFDLKPQEGPNDPLGPNVSKTPRLDFQNAIYAANESGLYKEELIILVNQNSK